jgi:hypothetical protein
MQIFVMFGDLLEFTDHVEPAVGDVMARHVPSVHLAAQALKYSVFIPVEGGRNRTRGTFPTTRYCLPNDNALKEVYGSYLRCAPQIASAIGCTESNARWTFLSLLDRLQVQR